MKSSERGASMVESSLVSLVTLLLVFGIMELSELMYAYHAVANGARLGTRWAIVRGAGCLDASCPATQTSITTYIKSQLPLLKTSQVTVSATWHNTSTCRIASQNGTGCTVTVAVTYPFSFDLPWIWNHSISLTSSSTMVISE
jgi:Flp pilus assembly protein TadG